MQFQYTYLILGFTYLFVWCIFFFALPKVRKEFIFMSVLFSAAGLVADYFYLKDWWQPITLSGSFISFEGFLTGLSIGGFTSIAYYLFTKKKESSKKIHLIKDLNKKSFLLFIGGLFILVLLVFFISNKNSFLTTTIPLLILLTTMFIKRPDLIKNSLISGLSMLIIGTLVYYFVDSMTPGWIEEFWVSSDLLKTKILSLPLNDVFWYFLVGMYIGPLFEVLFDKKY